MDDYTPFCGTPPLPGELLTRWTFDPVLIVGLGVALVLAWAATRQATQGERRQVLAGWALAAVLFVSPLCAASMALFSARVAQHLLLTLVAAPLLAPILRGRTPPPALAALAFAGLFWVWHLPGPYGATLRSDGIYWAMHLSLLGSAVVLWAAFRSHAARAPFATALAAAGTAAQMTLLSVLLVTSDRLWHPWHELTTVPYGMSAMGDQTLAGGLMWVAGGLIFVALVARIAFRFVQPAQAPADA